MELVEPLGPRFVDRPVDPFGRCDACGLPGALHPRDAAGRLYCRRFLSSDAQLLEPVRPRPLDVEPIVPVRLPETRVLDPVPDWAREWLPEDYGPAERLRLMEGWRYVPGRGLAPSSREIWDHWIGVWKERIADQYDVTMVGDGGRGVGKTTLFYKIFAALDPTFGLDRITYTAHRLIELYRELKPGQAALYDEAALRLLGNDKAKYAEGVLVAKAITIARFKRIIVGLLLSDVLSLQGAFKYDLCEYLVRIRRRGVAEVHPREQHGRYKPTSAIHMYPDRTWNPLRWTSLEGTETWEAYETRKDVAVNAALDELLEECDALEARGRPIATYPASCRKCGYAWSSRSPNPRRCPACNAFLSRDVVGGPAPAPAAEDEGPDLMAEWAAAYARGEVQPRKVA